jgi:hypothetical protein
MHEIQSFGPRKMGQDARYIWHTMCRPDQDCGNYRYPITGSTQNTCSLVLNTIKGLAHTTYLRELCLTQRVKFVHIYLLSKLWHCTQLLPIWYRVASEQHYVRIVCMEGERLSSPPIYVASFPWGRRTGPHTCQSEMSHLVH